MAQILLLSVSEKNGRHVGILLLVSIFTSASPSACHSGRPWKVEVTILWFEISWKQWQIRGWTPGRTFLKGEMHFRLAPSDLTLDDREGSKIKLIFLTWNVNNSKNYDVGPTSFSLDDLERWEIKGEGHKWAGDGDRHVGIYTSLDNWRTCCYDDYNGRVTVWLTDCSCDWMRSVWL